MFSSPQPASTVFFFQFLSFSLFHFAPYSIFLTHCPLIFLMLHHSSCSFSSFSYLSYLLITPFSFPPCSALSSISHSVSPSQSPYHHPSHIILACGVAWCLLNSYQTILISESVNAEHSVVEQWGLKKMGGVGGEQCCQLLQMDGGDLGLD